jgi:hypothetical protein
MGHAIRCSIILFFPFERIVHITVNMRGMLLLNKNSSRFNGTGYTAFGRRQRMVLRRQSEFCIHPEILFGPSTRKPTEKQCRAKHYFEPLDPPLGWETKKMLASGRRKNCRWRSKRDIGIYRIVEEWRTRPALRRMSHLKRRWNLEK